MQPRVSILFFLGSVVLGGVTRSYLLIQHSEVWSDARSYCRAFGTDLATAATAADLGQLQDLALSHNLNSSAWIGLYDDITSWRFSMGDVRPAITDWASTEPNNIGGHEECAMLNMGGWYDLTCDVKVQFVCFDDRIIGTGAYTLVTTLSTWYDARSYCRQYHTDLASARNSTENQIVKELTANQSPGYTWFGLFRDSWKWSDQTNVSDIAWMKLTLDSAEGNENCGYFDTVIGNALCSDLKPFFCSDKQKKMRQSLRMTIRSDQDVNYPALKEAILKQIEEKLETHGLENVTVHWKERPDGVVFIEKN